jgi:ABC-2 type transport system permease protein
MWSIFKKEVNSFFSSLIGYIAIGVFLLVMGLFLWVFPAFNIIDYGYATLDLMFRFAPSVLLVLIPAITMRSFAEETNLGTIELLATRPITDMQIIMGKYFASLFLVFFAILPTLIYYYSVYQLGSPVGNIDTGAFWGSFLGLMLIAGAFVAIGIFASSLTRDQIVAFIVAVLLSALFYLGFYYLSSLPIFFGKTDTLVESIGMDYHYQSVSRGLVDSRNMVYFISFIAAFILMTRTVLEKRKW